jgi:hypothetical protein
MSGVSFAAVAGIAGSVVVAVLPLVTVFLVFQVLFLQLPVKEVSRILNGTLLASLGLFLFLLGVEVAFLPFGRIVGEALGALPIWMIALFGMLLGFVTTWAEPALGILADQVEQASGGSIRRPLVLVTICAGVALIVGLGMLRIRYGIPLPYLLAPGYAIALAAMWLSKEEFVAVAIDAGGVATGPLVNSFLLALALGAASSLDGRDPLVHGLGMVALISLAPVLSLVALGVLVRLKESRKEA